MREAEASQLRNLGLFRGLTEENFTALLQAAALQWVPAQTVLLEEGKIPDSLFILLEGLVDLFTRYGKRESTLTVLRPVRAFVLASAVGGLPCVQSARALTRARILTVPASLLRGMVGRDPAFSRSVARELSVSYGCVSIELKSQKLRTGIERLANWIIRAHGHSGIGNRLSLPFDKRTLASRIGMTPENLSRSLAQLDKHGVTVNGREILIRDHAALAKLAKTGLI